MPDWAVVSDSRPAVHFVDMAVGPHKVIVEVAVHLDLVAVGHSYREERYQLERSCRAELAHRNRIPLEAVRYLRSGVVAVRTG